MIRARKGTPLRLVALEPSTLDGHAPRSRRARCVSCPRWATRREGQRCHVTQLTPAGMIFPYPIPGPVRLTDNINPDGVTALPASKDQPVLAIG